MDAIQVVDLAADPDCVDFARSCSDSGFVLVADHGVDAALIERVVSASRELFQADAEAKSAVSATEADPLCRGYKWPEGSQLESFAISHVAAENSPRTADVFFEYQNRIPAWVPQFQQTVDEYYDQVTRLSMRLMSGIARYHELPPDWFESAFEEHISALVLNYYRPSQDSRPRLEGHRDWGTLTVLHQDGPGLEVQLRDGAWVPMPQIPGTLVVNAGDLLSVWTNGRWRSAPHRVVGGSTSRISLAFFHQPGYSTIIRALPGHGEDRFPPIHSGKYFLAH